MIIYVLSRIYAYRNCEIYLFFPVRLQEPAVIAVDRLHRFRWSGGGGGSGKKSSSGPRSEKAERLRELTEKLKGPAPVPPPRRPSRVQASSPPPSGYQLSSQNYPQVRNSKRHNDEGMTCSVAHERAIFFSSLFSFAFLIRFCFKYIYIQEVKKKKMSTYYYYHINVAKHNFIMKLNILEII